MHLEKMTLPMPRSSTLKNPAMIGTNLFGQILISNKVNNQGQLVGSNKPPDNQQWVDRFFPDSTHCFFYCRAPISDITQQVPTNLNKLKNRYVNQYFA